MKTADLRGRARRMEFWSFLVFWIAVAVLMAVAFVTPVHPFTAVGAVRSLAGAPVLDVLIVGTQVYYFARPGTTGDNRYGPNPRTVHHRRISSTRGRRCG